MDSLEKKISELKPDFDNKEQIKQKSEDLLKIIRTNELIKINFELENRIKEGEIIINENNKQLELLSEKRGELANYNKEIKSKMPDLAQHSIAKEWYIKQESYNLQKSELNKELEAVAKEEERIIEKYISLMPDILLSDKLEINEIKSQISQLNEKLENYKTEISNLNSQNEHLLVQAKLEEYAQNLNSGSACPLCGSLEHPNLLNPKNVKEELGLNNKKVDKINANILNTDNLVKYLTETLVKYEYINQQTLNINNRIDNIDKEIIKHQLADIRKVYNDETLINKAYTDANNLSEIIKKTDFELEKTQNEIDILLKNKEKFRIGIEKINNDYTINKSEFNTLSSQLKSEDIEEFSSKSNDELSKTSKELVERYHIVANEYNSLTQNFAELKEKQHSIDATITANIIHNNSIIDEVNFLKREIENQLIKSSFESLAEVKNILETPINIEKEKENLLKFQENLNKLNQQLLQVQIEIGTRKYFEEEHQEIETEVLMIQESLKIKNQKLGEINGLIKKLITDFESQKAIKADLDLLINRGEELKTLKNLFKASGFVNYISSVYLQNLCNAANERFFKLSRQKLSLEITEENTFMIRDYMNGGKVRNVKTLSGGQTFQAALSLALALADNIQKITDSDQNFFFLDEGFGSLDKESLQIVFETLKSLRKENRIVGVISHVEEMQQEIDTHLVITNQEDVGSKIKRSWTIDKM